MDKFTETYLNIIEQGKIKDFATWAKEGLNGSRKEDKKNAIKERKKKMDELWKEGNISKLIQFIDNGDSDLQKDKNTKYYYGILLIFDRKKPEDNWVKKFEDGEEIFNTDDEEFEKGLGMVKTAAKDGSIEACAFLSKLYGADSNVQNLKEAKKWQRRAKELKQKQEQNEQKLEQKKLNKNKTTEVKLTKTEEEKTDDQSIEQKNKLQQVKKAIWDLMNDRGITKYQKQLLTNFIS